MPFFRRQPVEKGIEINTTHDRPGVEQLNGTETDLQCNRQANIYVYIEEHRHCLLLNEEWFVEQVFRNPRWPG